jgi:predicted kinase
MTPKKCAGDAALFVLVGGWPGSGKSTLARPLAAELSLCLLVKDEIKEALADALRTPADVAESRRLGRAAVLAMLRTARECRGAVLDSTWFEYTEPLVRDLPGQVVEVRCVLPVEMAKARYRARTGRRHPGHLDVARDDDELWGERHRPLGIGPVLDVDTSGPVDVADVARRVREAARDRR